MKLKSPFRYPGGKSHAVDILLPYFNDVDEVVSCFCGGGSLEIALAESGKRVRAYDNFDLLVNCWQQILNNREEAYKQLVEYYHLFWDSGKTHEELKEIYYSFRDKEIEGETNLVKKAMMFLVVNRCSFSGLTMLGGFSSIWRNEFGFGIVERIGKFVLPNFTVERQSFEKTIELNPNYRLYLDPPYYIKDQLYGSKDKDMHKTFDHKLLCELLHTRGNWIMSYNNCEEIKEMYKDFTILYPKWNYGMTSDRKMINKETKEVLILSKDIKPIIESTLDDFFK